jgi:hypothetical protein
MRRRSELAHNGLSVTYDCGRMRRYRITTKTCTWRYSTNGSTSTCAERDQPRRDMQATGVLSLRRRLGMMCVFGVGSSNG